MRILVPQSRVQETGFSSISCTRQTHARDLRFTGQIDPHKTSMQKQATRGNRLHSSTFAEAGGNRTDLVALVEATVISQSLSSGVPGVEEQWKKDGARSRAAEVVSH